MPITITLTEDQILNLTNLHLTLCDGETPNEELIKTLQEVVSQLPEV